MEPKYPSWTVISSQDIPLRSPFPALRRRTPFHCAALLLATLVWCSPLSADTPIYRWVDKSGTVHFSDEAGPGASRVELPPPATISLPKPSPESKVAELPLGALRPGYEHLEITFPRPDSAFHSGDGTFTVTTQIEPPLVPSHELRLLLDGQVYATGRSGQFLLSHIDRGTHQLQLEVVQDGEVIQSSPAVTFTLHRPSVLQPNRARAN